MPFHLLQKCLSLVSLSLHLWKGNHKNTEAHLYRAKCAYIYKLHIFLFVKFKHHLHQENIHLSFHRAL